MTRDTCHVLWEGASYDVEAAAATAAVAGGRPDVTGTKSPGVLAPAAAAADRNERPGAEDGDKRGRGGLVRYGEDAGEPCRPLLGEEGDAVPRVRTAVTWVPRAVVDDVTVVMT